ncbi:TetR/AcrR family transcriptional regulator [bacterium]|nr:MAG: TetR/AcrR family transcriptional regulator [bacterium]
MGTSSTPSRSTRPREKSRSRDNAEKQELRASILRAASEEFLGHGYEGFSLRRVAERVGYTPTTIYLYFRDKDELLFETARDGFVAFDATIQAAATQSDPRERLRALGRAYFEFGVNNAAHYRLMFMQRADFLLPRLVGTAASEELHAAALLDPDSAHRVIAQDLLVGAVRDGIEAGLFRAGEPIAKADALWAGIHGLTALALSPLMSPEHARSVADELLDTLIRGLEP